MRRARLGSRPMLSAVELFSLEAGCLRSWRRCTQADLKVACMGPDAERKRQYAAHRDELILRWRKQAMECERRGETWAVPWIISTHEAQLGETGEDASRRIGILPRDRSKGPRVGDRQERRPCVCEQEASTPRAGLRLLVDNGREANLPDNNRPER